MTRYARPFSAAGLGVIVTVVLAVCAGTVRRSSPQGDCRDPLSLADSMHLPAPDSARYAVAAEASLPSQCRELAAEWQRRLEQQPKTPQ